MTSGGYLAQFSDFTDEETPQLLDLTDLEEDQTLCSQEERSWTRETRRRYAREPRSPRSQLPPHPPQSFGTNDTFSSIPSHGDVTPPTDLKLIYGELQEINLKLKKEFQVLRDKDHLLSKREKDLHAAQETLQKTISLEVAKRIALKDQEYQLQIEKLDLTVKEKTKETKRLKENFDTLKKVNDNLRKELEQLQKEHSKLEKQTGSLQARMTNLQRKKGFQEKRDENLLPQDLVMLKKWVAKENNETVKSVGKPKLSTTSLELLSLLFEWVAELHLRPAVVQSPTKPLDGVIAEDFIIDKCWKVMPHMVDILRELPSSKNKIVLPYLQFIYWSILHLEMPHSQQKTGLGVTLRRVGEELYRHRGTSKSEEKDSDSFASSDKEAQKDGVYLHSSHLHVRFLSALIILRTINQVDHLAHACDVIRHDMKSEGSRELFVHYQATAVLLTHLKPTNKALTNVVMDIYLQMSMESICLGQFLQSCSTETWFRSISMVWRLPTADLKLLEKISIILQKLSKIRTNKKYFEVFSLITSAQEMLRSTDPENAFLVLNIKSVLFNLTSPKTTDTANAVLTK